MIIIKAGLFNAARPAGACDAQQESAAGGTGIRKKETMASKARTMRKSDMDDMEDIEEEEDYYDEDGSSYQEGSEVKSFESD